MENGRGKRRKARREPSRRRRRRRPVETAAGEPSHASDGHPPVDAVGVGAALCSVVPGETLVADLVDPNRARGTVGLIQQAINKGWLRPWQIDPAFVDRLPAMIRDSLERSIDRGDERTFLRGVEVLRGMAADNLKLAEATDREARLDYGLPTSNVGTYKLTFDTND